MTDVLRSRLGAAWLLLVAATVASAVVGWGQGGGTTAGAVVLAITFAKAWIVGREFMEVRTAPAWLRAVFGAWCAVVGGALVVLLLVL